MNKKQLKKLRKSEEALSYLGSKDFYLDKVEIKRLRDKYFINIFDNKDINSSITYAYKYMGGDLLKGLLYVLATKDPILQTIHFDKQRLYTSFAATQARKLRNTRPILNLDA